MAEFPFDAQNAEHIPAGVITKDSDHPISGTLLGEVVAVHWLQDALVLYYADKHKAIIAIHEDELSVADYEVSWHS